MPLVEGRYTKSYTRHLAYWESRIGDLTLEELNRKRLFEERELLQQTPYTKPNGQLCIRSNKTVNRYISALSALYLSAEKDFGWIDENTKHPTSTLRVLKEGPGRERVPLTKKEIFRLFDAITSLETECHDKFPGDNTWWIKRKNGHKRKMLIGNPKLECLVYLALTTGARDMELRGLKKADVNTFKKEITFRDTKNGTNRTVKLIGDSVKLLNKLQADPRYHDSDYVFASTKNPNRPYDIRVPFKKALEKAGITDFHFHDLRHCVTSFLVELKVPESAIMRIQGWSERDRIDIYRHNPEHDAKEQKKLVRNLPRRAG